MYDVMESRDLRIPENMHKEYIHILVSNPTIHNTHEDGRYTTYQVSLKTNSPSFSLKYSVVDRRYSDFTWLRRVLARTTDVKPPNLPFGGIIGTFTKRYLDERQTILTEFLRKVVRQTLYLSNSALHLFLQTRLAKKEMDAMLKDARRRGSMNCIRKAVALHGPVYPPVSNKEPVDYASSDFPLSSRDSSVIRSSGSFGSFRDDSDTSSDALSCTNSIQNQQNNNLKVEESDWVIIDLDESQVDDEKAIEFTAYTDITWSSPSDVDISCLNSPGSSDVSVCDSFPLKSHIIDIRHRGSIGDEVAQSSSLGTLTSTLKTRAPFPRSSSENVLHSKNNRHVVRRRRRRSPGSKAMKSNSLSSQCSSELLHIDATDDQFSTPKENQVIERLLIEAQDHSTPKSVTADVHVNQLSKNNEDRPLSGADKLLIDPPQSQSLEPTSEEITRETVLLEQVSQTRPQICRSASIPLTGQISVPFLRSNSMDSFNKNISRAKLTVPEQTIAKCSGSCYSPKHRFGKADKGVITVVT